MSGGLSEWEVQHTPAASVLLYTIDPLVDRV